VPLIQRATFESAITNIAKRGDTDIFPLPIENHVLHDRQSEVLDLLMAMVNEFSTEVEVSPPVNHSGLSPAGYNGFRWATQLDPIWNAYLLGLVLELAPAIEARRVPVEKGVVFSYRFAPGVDGRLFADSAWENFQERSRELVSRYDYVVSVDIADFYSRIYHHRIENELKYVDSGANIAKQIIAILKSVSNGVSYGLPVGGPAARILSELLLNATDKLLSARAEAPFVRYADALLQNEGLSLQRAKTRIYSASEFEATLRPIDPQPGSASKFLSLHLHFDPYSDTAEEDYELLRERLDEFNILELLSAELAKSRIDAAVTRRLIGALKFLDADIRLQALLSLLQNVETLAPVFPQVMRAVREGLDGLNDDQQEEVQKALRKMVTAKTYVTQVNVNLAYLVQALGKTRSQENEELLTRLYSAPQGFAQTPAPNIQREIVLILARWRANYFLHNLRPHFGAMHEWVQRSFIVASFVLGDEGRHWRESAKRRFGAFDTLVMKWAAEKSQVSSWEIPI
jgi:hypothetical protein